ncbi:RsmB/NOP family class I SAM-dependent RNA methyltransferase [Zymomonas mobilis]|uniref:Fmu (Sun) domain protein n=1 Tax=Zymomonas mobilis subsp. pomaceae (strain ATCC 29192 / DSM 22645 / JCM 10191 / CCUG 17912 / NBRC 13757 / NCIMB 11200 / NRRL B-4491 / Barker I) TaxID=579138 RepID=F8ETU1_ZYMMT|nr:RsmB/NOP family class I SAM-dependent RNA methyltransferase [Zymomonas mobilis]AEI38038.1 Fmu (Sun) domain protein [Zymomonas mobilis subsp. pomaceae ATCC 29192]MDX5949405.1 RsmB/NOP family class I SAM-dependent RNA methyltransferase [Zymomonas mobilis subsp. pomaceae]GEB89148.1 MFS transporter [Zymomonas mobilis subsp. pomaceae]
MSEIHHPRPKRKDKQTQARSQGGRASSASQKRNPQRKDANPIGLPVRQAALQLLEAILRQGLPLEQVIGRITQGLKQPADRSLVHAIVASVLRWRTDIDALIDSATAKPLADDVKARMVLRIALAQKLVLKQPAHVAIATVLPLVDGGPRRLVHGVYGTLDRREDVALPEYPTLPEETAWRWKAAWGGIMVEKAEQALAEQPPVDLTLQDPEKTDHWAKTLEGSSLIAGHVRLPSEHKMISELAGYQEGAWWVQDISASLPARLLGKGEGQQVLDLCAAPGGKTMQLASQGWQVTAVDIAAKRLERLSENLKRLHLEAKIVTANLADYTPKDKVDAVLLDAPCSASGIFRRHPDVLYRVDTTIIKQMAEQQKKLLERAADWVKIGGKLIYAVCSLEPEEGEEVVQAFLKNHPDYRLNMLDPALLPPGIIPTKDRWLRILPQSITEKGGNDGFFIAYFTRYSEKEAH